MYYGRGEGPGGPNSTGDRGIDRKQQFAVRSGAPDLSTLTGLSGYRREVTREGHSVNFEMCDRAILLAAKERRGTYCCVDHWKMEERTPDLIPDIWERLHIELVGRVLSKLPFSSQKRFRLVCKQWKAIIESPGVVHECPSSKSVLFYHHPDGHVGVNGRWVKSFLAFHDLKKNCWERQNIENYPAMLRENLVAVDEGLLCFSSESTPDAFVVFNPLSKQWRSLKLPPTQLPSDSTVVLHYNLIGMVMDRETGTYKLVVARIHPDTPRETHTYNSLTSCWKRSAPVPPIPTLKTEKWMGRGKWRNCQQGVCCAGNLFWLVYDDNINQIGMRLYTLLRYNVQRDEWTLAQETTPRKFPSRLHMVHYMDNVVLLDWSNPCRARELVAVGPEVKDMDRKLIRQGRKYNYKARKGVAFGGRLFIVYANFPNNDDLVVQAYNDQDDRTSHLRNLEHVNNSNMFWAFAPTLRAYV